MFYYCTILGIKHQLNQQFSLCVLKKSDYASYQNALTYLRKGRITEKSSCLPKKLVLKKNTYIYTYIHIYKHGVNDDPLKYKGMG